MTLLKRAVLVAAASLLAAVAALGTAGGAQAASNNFRLCNYGSDYEVRSEAGPFLFPSGYVRPQQCTEFHITPGTSVHLRYRRIYDGMSRMSSAGGTYGSGRTLIQTWGSFLSPSYGKLPY
ncbi:hypothetical protein ACQPYE_17165 [Actinosynnema sp. CA-299493]